MQLAERGRDRADGVPSTEEGPALRDAAAAAARAEADEAEALSARERFQHEPLEAIEPDEAIGPHLLPDELVHALRTRAILRAPGGDSSLGYGGTLYLTSQRLVHLGQVVIVVQLSDIVESSLAGERILLTLRDSEGLSLEVDRPRLLRAMLAEATRGGRR